MLTEPREPRMGQRDDSLPVVLVTFRRPEAYGESLCGGLRTGAFAGPSSRSSPDPPGSGLGGPAGPQLSAGLTRRRDDIRLCRAYCKDIPYCTYIYYIVIYTEFAVGLSHRLESTKVH